MFDKSKYYYFLKIYICYMYGIVVYFSKMFKNIGVKNIRDVIIVYETFIFMSFVWLLILNVLFLLDFVLVLDCDI